METQFGFKETKVDPILNNILAENLYNWVFDENSNDAMIPYYNLAYIIADHIKSLKQSNPALFQSQKYLFTSVQWGDPYYAIQIALNKSMPIGKLVAEHWFKASNGKQINDISINVQFSFALVASILDP
jgi:hypothetical protein